MRIPFGGLETALTGLYSSQKAITVSTHNITNAATEGYTREVAESNANIPLSGNGVGMIGTGSDLETVTRMRDDYVDSRYWSQAQSTGEWGVKESALGDFESVLDESDNSGFTQVMNDFYTSLQDLSKDPSSYSARAALKEKAISLSNYFNSAANQFQRLQRDYNFGIKSKVDEINSYAKQIQDLNDQIYKTELDGSQANDLRDQRQLVLDKLSKIVNISVDEKAAGTNALGQEIKTMTVSINGHALVNHTNLYEIQYIQRTAAQRKNPTDIDGLYDLQWSDGNKFNLSGGELKAYIDVRDGNGDVTTGSQNAYKGVPYYMQRLNYFVQNFVKNINEGTATDSGFTSGYALDGSTGIKLFTASNAMSAAFTDYTTITAANMGVSGDIMAGNGANKIPASDVYGEAGNANILGDVLDQRHDTTMFGEGAPEDFMKSLISTMAVDSQESQKMSNQQDAVLKNIDNKRESVSGVSIDEEMANIVKYQKIYSASATLMQTMSSLYDIMLNKLGAS